MATKIGKLDTKGLDPIGDDAIPVFSNLDLRKGQIFDHQRYLSEKLEMQGRLKSLGYAWAEVDGAVVVDRDHHIADVTLTVRPGPKALIRSLEVAGAYNVEPRLLIRHSLLERGSLLTSDALENARAKLYNLGFLSTVRIDYRHDPNHPEQADVVLAVGTSLSYYIGHRAFFPKAFKIQLDDVPRGLRDGQPVPCDRLHDLGDRHLHPAGLGQLEYRSARCYALRGLAHRGGRLRHRHAAPQVLTERPVP